MSDVTVNLNSNPVSVNFGNLDTVSGASALTTANRLVKVSGSGGVTMATIAESGITGVLTITKTGSTARTATFPDEAIEVQSTPTEQSANFTARNNASYIATASLTVTDPTPVQGLGFTVFVRNGTATVGGTGYAAGQTIRRVYHSGAWSNTVIVSCGSAALTSGRVPFATTGGLLTDATSLLFNSSTQVFTVGSGSGAVTASLNVNGAAGQTRQWAFQSGGVDRWHMRCDSTAESGSDAGSAFVISARTDAGGLIDFPISITRAAGGAISVARPLTSTGVVTVPNGTAAAPGLRLTSEASGLYRIGATSIGVSVAGSLVLTVGSTASSFASGTTLTVSNTTASTSTTTGALVVSGGVGVAGAIYGGSSLLSVNATAGIGYATGAGGTVTQITSRTTGVTINKVCGQITLVSAAGSTSWQSFTVTNSAVATTDTVRVCQDSGTDKYMIHVTAVGAGSFEVTYATTGGTTTEQPVFNFSVMKAVAA